MELQARTGMSQKGIPQDIAMNVLAKLSIKDLIRFKSVSKHWRLIISDPLFAQCYDKKPPMNLNWSNNKAYKMGPWDKLLGYDDGLLCVRTKTGDVLLMNPTTGECRNLKLPDEYSRGADGTYRYYKYMGGIGYAKSTGDYKVVAIFFDGDTSTEKNRVMVFPLRENRWRVASGALDFRYSRGRNGVHRAPVNGAIHWVVTAGERGRVIVALDLATEEIKELPLPEEYGGVNCKVHLGCAEGSLAVVLHNKPYKRPHFLRVWLMEVYGVASSWTRVSLDRISGWKGPVFDLTHCSGDADQRRRRATTNFSAPTVSKEIAFVETSVSPYLADMKLV